MILFILLFMKIYLTRHGETHFNRKRMMQGQLDTNLTDLGVTQAINISNRLKGFSFSKIYSSDLKRASDTANQINLFHGLNIIFDDRLRETHFGDFQGKTQDEVDWDSLEGDFLDRKPNGGESKRDHINRVKNFLDELSYDDDILIVSHGGTMRCLFHILLEEEMDLFKVRPKNTALYIFEKTENGFKLILDNCDIHNEVEEKN